MKRLLFLLLLSGSVTYGQALRDINFKHLYDPAEALSFVIKPARLPDGWQIFYKLQLRDTAVSVSDYTIQWDMRTSLAEKSGTTQGVEVSIGQSPVTHGTWGKVTVPTSANVQLLVATVTNTVLKKAWIFYQVLDPKFPVNGGLYTDGHIVFEPYIKAGNTYSIGGGQGPRIVSFYRDDFPAGSPVFSESIGKVSSLIKIDSTFTTEPQQPLTFAKNGLYLVQADTAAAEGFAFRVSDDYPRYGQVQNLADPLIYVCTKQEFDRVKLAKGDKRAFDKVILTITGDPERAKRFMRSYFRRVELANQFFTSYKEGWKTDRGMIYVIFGLPNQVYKFSDREVWQYNNDTYKVTFNFAKSPSLFDPENYVLIRENKLRDTWYEVIDLWRNARF